MALAKATLLVREGVRLRAVRLPMLSAIEPSFRPLPALSLFLPETNDKRLGLRFGPRPSSEVGDRSDASASAAAAAATASSGSARYPVPSSPTPRNPSSANARIHNPREFRGTERRSGPTP